MKDDDPSSGWWRRKDGSSVRIEQMDDQHLRNAIAMIIRREFKWRPRFYYPLLAEIARRGAEEKRF